jgi:hypothetical protein
LPASALAGGLNAASAADGNAAQLRERVAGARLRFMELTSRYFAETTKESSDALQRREIDREALCASGARYALLLRSLGEPPERTLILIKTAFVEAAPIEGTENRETLEAVVKSIVMAYFAA